MFALRPWPLAGCTLCGIVECAFKHRPAHCHRLADAWPRKKWEFAGPAPLALATCLPCIKQCMSTSRGGARWRSRHATARSCTLQGGPDEMQAYMDNVREYATLREGIAEAAAAPAVGPSCPDFPIQGAAHPADATMCKNALNKCALHCSERLCRAVDNISSARQLARVSGCGQDTWRRVSLACC